MLHRNTCVQCPVLSPGQVQGWCKAGTGPCHRPPASRPVSFLVVSQCPVTSLQWHLGTHSPALPWLVPRGEWGILCLYSGFAEWQVSQQLHFMSWTQMRIMQINNKQSQKQLGWLWVLDGLYHFWRLLPQKVNVKIKNTICNVNIYYMILINIKLKPGILNQIILRQLDVSLSLIIMTYTHAVTLYLVFTEL